MKNLYLCMYTFLIQCICLLLLILCACQNNDKNTVQIIKVGENLRHFKPFKLSEICSDLEYISLESPENRMVGQIKYLDITDRYIVIFDWKKCLLFNRSGKFLRQISKMGRGPGEFSNPGQIKIYGNKIFIPDAKDNSLKIYNVDGKYIESVRSPGRFSNQVMVSNYMLISDSLFLVQEPNITGYQKYRIHLINKNGEILKSYRNSTFYDSINKPRFVSTDFAAQFYKLGDEIRYKELLNDTVWQLENFSLKPIYLLDRGKYGTPNNIRSLPTNILFQKLAQAIQIDLLFETKQYIIIRTQFRKYYPFDFYRQTQIDENPYRNLPHDILGVYDKLNDDFFFVTPSNLPDQLYPTGIENDFDCGINFIPEYKIEPDLMINWIYPYELKKYVLSKSFKNSIPLYPAKKKELEQLAKSLDENDNPVLMLVKLKD